MKLQLSMWEKKRSEEGDGERGRGREEEEEGDIGEAMEREEEQARRLH